MSAANIIIAVFMHRVWRQNRLSLATKLRIYTTCVLAVGLDAVEGRLTQAAGIPHDMPQTYSWH